MRKITLLTLIALVSSLFSAFGQDTTSTEESKAGSLSISGYVDAYYTYNFNKPPHTAGLAWENAGRIFDIKHNEISLGLAQTKFAYTKGRLTGVIDLTYGPNAALGNFGNVFGSDIHIKQAYMDLGITDKLTFTIGQFGTHVGYELIDAPLNFNYSLSYLFGNGPFYHTGAKLAYSFSDKFGVMAGVVNGWDSGLDFNDKKSFIAQVYAAPVEGWDIYVNWVGGDEQNGVSFPTISAVDSASTVSHIFDLTTAYQVTDKFKVGLNAAYGTGNLVRDTMSILEEKYKNGSWYGAALYLNYAISDKVGLGLRAERFKDEEGLRYFAPTTVTEFTLTGDFKFAGGNFMWKPEIRFDTAADDVFLDEDGLLTNSTQLTIGTAFIFAF